MVPAPKASCDKKHSDIRVSRPQPPAVVIEALGEPRCSKNGSPRQACTCCRTATLHRRRFAAAREVLRGHRRAKVPSPLSCQATRFVVCSGALAVVRLQWRLLWCLAVVLGSGAFGAFPFRGCVSKRLRLPKHFQAMHGARSILLLGTHVVVSKNSLVTGIHHGCCPPGKSSFRPSFPSKSGPFPVTKPLFGYTHQEL